jgi:hypothetical protein
MDATTKDYNLEKSGIYGQITKKRVWGVEIAIGGSALVKGLQVY